MVESLAAMAVVFMLFLVVTQVAFGVVARDTAQSAVEAAARRASRAGADPAAEAARLEAEIMRIVPGATSVEVVIEPAEADVSAGAAIRWLPPGPDLVPVTIRTTAIAARVIPP